MEKSDSVLIDTRNFYEYDIGHFSGSLNLNSNSFSESIPIIQKILDTHIARNKNSNFLFYCTGGIRCEYLVPYLSKQNYRNLYQLEGGIINYAATVREKNLKSKFVGKNFVFDSRMSEPITGDVL